MSQTLYSLRSHIDHEGRDSFVITKFVDGEVESSYHTSRTTCTCPAGQRPTCRHRQMLPQMLNADIINTHWFYDYDRGGHIVDFEGTTRTAYERATAQDITMTADCPPGCCEPFPEPHSETVITEAFDASIGGSNPPAVAKHPWRRL